jgi:hypothetical protein
MLQPSAETVSKLKIQIDQKRVECWRLCREVMSLRWGKMIFSMSELIGGYNQK